MQSTFLLLSAVGLGVGGAFTPCALGLNLLVLGRMAGQSRGQRLVAWLQFALARAAVLTLLGVGIGTLGLLLPITWGMQLLINVLLIALGALFIVSRFRSLPIPAFSVLGAVGPSPHPMPLLGALVGLDISACLLPLVLGLLAQTIRLGAWLTGGAALFLFGIGLSLPLLLAVGSDHAARRLRAWSQRYRTPFYLIAGGLLIVLGAAELWLSWLS